MEENLKKTLTVRKVLSVAMPKMMRLDFRRFLLCR